MQRISFRFECHSIVATGADDAAQSFAYIIAYSLWYNLLDLCNSTVALHILQRLSAQWQDYFPHTSTSAEWMNRCTQPPSPSLSDYTQGVVPSRSQIALRRVAPSLSQAALRGAAPSLPDCTQWSRALSLSDCTQSSRSLSPRLHSGESYPLALRLHSVESLPLSQTALSRVTRSHSCNEEVTPHTPAVISCDGELSSLTPSLVVSTKFLDDAALLRIHRHPV